MMESEEVQFKLRTEKQLKLLAGMFLLETDEEENEKEYFGLLKRNKAFKRFCKDAAVDDVVVIFKNN